MANFWTGTPSSWQQSPNRFEPWQQDIFQQLKQHGQERLQDPTKGFEPVEKQAIHRYQTQVLPSLAERFGQLGGGGYSSGAMGAIGQNVGDFYSNLAAQKAQYGAGQEGQMANMLQSLLTPQTEMAYQPDQPGALHPMMQGVGQAIPGVAAEGMKQLMSGAGSGGAGGGGGWMDAAGDAAQIGGSFFGPAGTAGGTGIKYLLKLLPQLIKMLGGSERVGKFTEGIMPNTVLPRA